MHFQLLQLSKIPPQFPDYKLEQITNLIQASDIHRMENKQKEFNKKSRKKLKTYNSYASPKFLVKKISTSSLPKAQNVQKMNDTFVSKSDKYTISAPLTATGNIILKKKTPKAFRKASKSKKNTYTFMISLPNKENNTFSGQAKVAKKNTVVYEDYQENTDVVVQAFKGSVRVLTILNDADAPSEYEYDVNVPVGGHMKKLQDGSIKILDKNEKFEGGFAPAWALDKNGKKVPTHYEIRGNKLIQVIEHLSVNVTYPIVADPHYGAGMIRQAFWRYRKQPSGNHWYDYRLTVIPTDFGRSLTAKYFAKEGWKQLYSMVSYLNYNTASMREQYYCHINFAWLQSRTEYHLEHWRPHTSWFKMLRYGCNPPGHM